MLRLITAAIAVALVSSGLTTGQERATFTVGTATAARGQKATGAIEVPAGSDAALSIPVAVFHGAKPGPVLALVAGAHGTEYTSIIALEKLIGMLNPAEISGTVIIVPLINIQSFEQKVPHLNPVDRKSMNRFYPGKMDGTQTERASFLITKQVVEQCDHLIDLHGGDLDESLRPYSYWTRTGNQKQDQISREMVLAFGLDHIIISTDRPKDPQASRYLENTATTRGKPSITAEAGHAGSRSRRPGSVSQWLSERDAVFEDAAGRTGRDRASGLDRKGRDISERTNGHLLSAGPPRYLCRARDEGRLRN